MALVRVRHASIYDGATKVAEMFKNKYHIGSGDEPMFGDEGFEGMTDGAITTTLEFDTIVPTAGMSFDPDDAMLNKRDLQISIGTISGKVHQVEMRMTDADYESDAKAGSLTGSFKCFGGTPSVT